MFFIIVNIVLCAVMVAASFSIDRHGRVSNNNNSLVNIILVIASLFALMAGDVALCLWGPKQLSLLVGRFMYVVMGWFCVSVCNYMLVFPNYNKSRLLSFTRWVFYGLVGLCIPGNSPEQYVLLGDALWYHHSYLHYY